MQCSNYGWTGGQALLLLGEAPTSCKKEGLEGADLGPLLRLVGKTCYNLEKCDILIVKAVKAQFLVIFHSPLSQLVGPLTFSVIRLQKVCIFAIQCFNFLQICTKCFIVCALCKTFQLVYIVSI